MTNTDTAQPKGRNKSFASGKPDTSFWEGIITTKWKYNKKFEGENGINC